MPNTPSYGVKKVNENIMYEGRVLIITDLHDIDFKTLPNGTIYVNKQTGEAKIKLEGATDWSVFTGFGQSAASSKTVEDLKKDVQVLQAKLEEYEPKVNQNSDSVSHAADTINDLVKKTADYENITERQDRQILEFGRRLNAAANYKEDLKQERIARMAGDSQLQGSIKRIDDKVTVNNTAFFSLIDDEKKARTEADSKETEERKAQVKAESDARDAGDREEANERKEAIAEEQTARKNADADILSQLASEESERQTHDTTLQNQITAQKKNLETESKARQAADASVRSDLTKTVENNLAKIQNLSDHLDTIKFQLENSLKTTENDLSKTVSAEETARQQADNEIRADYIAKINKAKISLVDSEQKVTDHGIRLNALESSTEKISQNLTKEKNERLAKDSAQDKTLESLDSATKTNADAVALEQKARIDKDKELNNLILDKATTQNNNLTKEIEERKAADAKIQENADATKTYVDTLVEQGGAKCISIDKVVAPNNGVSVVFPHGGLTPYERSVKVLVLDNEEGSRTNGMYINAEAICTTAYTDTEYRLYNDSETTHTFRLVFS